jgi:hypothetical protein
MVALIVSSTVTSTLFTIAIVVGLDAVAAWSEGLHTWSDRGVARVSRNAKVDL